MASYQYHSPAMANTAAQHPHHHHHPYQQQQQQQHHQHYPQGPTSAYLFQQAAASSSLQYPPEVTPNRGFANDDDDLPAVNMAGFGARNFARQQQEEARRHAEREQQMMDEQHRARLAEERYYAAKSRSAEEHNQWEEEQRIYREQQHEAQRQHEQQQEWHRRQEQDRRYQHAKAMSSSSSPLARTIPLRNHSYSSSKSPSLRELRLQDASARPSSRSSAAVSDAFWPPGSRSGSSRLSSASGSSSSGASSSNNRLRPIQHTSVRKTVYEDDYEETDEFAGGRPRQSQMSRSSYGQEELPLAKCANCGESLPFEELVDHVCTDRFESPLFSGPPTPLLAPEAGTEMVRGASAPCRTPFLEKYAQVIEKSSSPLLQPSTLPVSSSPISRELPSSNNGRASPATDAAKRVEELRRERIRQIEEQRAAKQVIVSSKPSPHESNYRPSGTKTHNRQPGSLASSSVSSTQSSALGFTFATTPCTETMTPSSSVESVKSSHSDRLLNEARDLIKQARAERIKENGSPVKKSGLDIDGIENLFKDIGTEEETPRKAHNMPPRPSSTEGQTASRSKGLNLTLASRSQRKAKRGCSICLQTFPKGHPMVEKNGKIFCIDDYAELYLEKCRKCARPVRDVGVRSQDVALSGLFHRDCFSCFRCNAAFQDNTFYIFENAPYCGKHYHHLNGTTCHSCNSGIEGKCRQLETGERFHPNCLTCEYENGGELCTEALTDYYVVKDKRLCEHHFEKVQNRLLGSGLGANIAEAARLKAGKRMTFMQTFEARKGKA